MSSPRFPPELLDHIVDILHNKREALKNCCLVSRSWVPRTRRHLFAHVSFETEEVLESWKKTFPDPSTSPAPYTNKLSINCLNDLTTMGAEPGDWIRGFSNVVDLEAVNRGTRRNEAAASLVPLHGLSPIVKSLRVDFIILPSTQVFDLVLSFPLLEDLTVVTSSDVSVWRNDQSDVLPAVVLPSNLPVFTGSLELSRAGTKPFARRLLSLPGGIHFRRLSLTQFYDEDISLATQLVEECSHTLESLDVTCSLYSGSEVPLFDLSRATKLGDAVFRPTSLGVGWITRALQTMAPERRGLPQISIHVPYYLAYVNVDADVKQTIGETNFGQWLDLDRLLIQLWESRLIRPKVVREVLKCERKDCIGCLLPEATRIGMIDLVE